MLISSYELRCRVVGYFIYPQEVKKNRYSYLSMYQYSNLIISNITHLKRLFINTLQGILI